MLTVAKDVSLTSPNPLQSNFAEEIIFTDDYIFVAAPGSDYKDPITGSLLTKAGAVYRYDRISYSVDTITSPNPTSNGYFGRDMCANKQLVFIAENTIDTSQGETGPVYAFDISTLTLLFSVDPPSTPYPRPPRITANDHYLFILYESFISHKSPSTRFDGIIRAVSVNPQSPIFSSDLFTMPAPYSGKDPLSFTSRISLIDQCLTVLTWQHTPTADGLVAAYILFYELQHIGAAAKPDKLVPVPLQYGDRSVYPYIRWKRVGDHLIFNLPMYRKISSDSGSNAEWSDAAAFIPFSGDGTIEADHTPIVVEFPRRSHTGNFGFAVHVDLWEDYLVTGTPYANFKDTSGNSYFGEVLAYSFPDMLQGAVASPAVTLLQGTAKLPRMGHFEISRDAMCVVLSQYASGGILDLYRMSRGGDRKKSKVTDGVSTILFRGSENARIDDLWNADMVSVGSNADRANLHSSTQSMLLSADTDPNTPSKLSPIAIVDGKRDVFTQAVLYARYRKGLSFGGVSFPKAALPGQSYHEYGLAVDIVKSQADQLKPSLEKAGFKQEISEAWHFTASSSSAVPSAINKKSENLLSAQKFEKKLVESFTLMVDLNKLIGDREALEKDKLVLESEINSLELAKGKAVKSLSAIEKKRASAVKAVAAAESNFISAKNVYNGYTYKACPNGNPFSQCDHADLKAKFTKEKNALYDDMEIAGDTLSSEKATLGQIDAEISGKKAEISSLDLSKKKAAIALVKVRTKIDTISKKILGIEDDRSKLGLELASTLAAIDANMSL